jgi:hypothetical protein
MRDGETPPAHCRPPPLNPLAGRYIAAFDALTDDRPVGETAGPIPTAAILAYARHVDGVTGRRALRRYIRMVRAIDRAALDRHRADRNGSGG